MDKCITNIKDLVIQFMTNGKEMEAKAKEGDAASCFQMGMSHLLGIKASVDFKKASQFFCDQSLADDKDALRLLGFIAEQEGDYSLAFENYANAAGDNSKQSYIDKIIKERTTLQEYLKKLDIHEVLNSQISAILADYKKGGESKVDASIKIATICDDKPACILAAQSLCEVEDYYSASKWLQNAKVPSNNPLYATIEENMEKSMKGLNLSSTIEIVELEGDKLLNNGDLASPYINAKRICDEVSSSKKLLWIDLASQMTNEIKKKLDEEEAARKKKEEEAARKKKEEEEARKKKEEEEARKKKEEEAARKKKEKDEARKKKNAEEEKKKLKKRGIDIVLLLFFVPLELVILAVMLTYENGTAFSNLIGAIIMSTLFVVLPFMTLRWLIRKIMKLNK